MSRILHLRKRLIALPAAHELPDVTIRPFIATRPGSRDADARAWLKLREAVFSGLVAGGRPWTAADFHREFLGKPWWVPERMLFAVAAGSGGESILGSVTFGRSGRPPDDYGSVQWLMVRPEQRRRGIGRLLLSTIERQALSAGETSLTLETHAAWSDAVRLYRAAGYE